VDVDPGGGAVAPAPDRRPQQNEAMSISPLGPAELARLRGQPLTYPEVGSTRGDLPAGYAHVRRSRALPGTVGFGPAAEALLGWQLQARSGLAVETSSPRVEPDAVVQMWFGLGALAVRVPCRVVYVVDEPDRQGFAYGTLPGHPVSGEEFFVLDRGAGGPVLTVTAFSRPATRLARLGGPAGRAVQSYLTGRYLRALDS
jgi:uncharacterized protein (UPF0548 family)